VKNYSLCLKNLGRRIDRFKNYLVEDYLSSRGRRIIRSAHLKKNFFEEVGTEEETSTVLKNSKLKVPQKPLKEFWAKIIQSKKYPFCLQKKNWAKN
jgi:hypothetical protein